MLNFIKIYVLCRHFANEYSGASVVLVQICVTISKIKFSPDSEYFEKTLWEVGIVCIYSVLFFIIAFFPIYAERRIKPYCIVLM